MTPEAIANFGISDSFEASVLGFAIVFFVLIVLMFMIKIMRTVVEGMAAKEAVPAVAMAAAAPAAPAANPNMVPAKGSLGEVRLHDVDDKTAALLMAIVADELKAPLNELRFLSIREKK